MNTNFPAPTRFVQSAAALTAAFLATACDLGVQKTATIPAPPVRGAAIQKLEPAPAATVTTATTAATPSGTSATTAALTPPTGEPAEMIGEFQVVGFDKLASFNYDIPDESPSARAAAAVGEAPSKEQIPAGVRALNGKKVALKGFMLPLKVEGGLITELLIMRDQSACCYGATPKINEWVSVKMAGKGVKPVMDVPITLFGKLQVGEMRENGYLVGIYAMDGEKMGGPVDL